MKKLTQLISIILLAPMALLAQTADEIVAKHNEARGGSEKLKAIRSLLIENTLEANGMDFENKMTLITGKAMKSETKIMGNQMVQAYDGAQAWTIRPSMMGGTGEPEPMPDNMVAGVSRQTDPFPLIDIAAKGTKVELAGEEKVKGNDNYHLKITFKDNDTVDMWVDKATYFVSKMTVVQMGQAQDLFYSNHKVIDGVSFPFTMEFETQMGPIAMKTNKIIINPTVDESIFKMK